MPSTSTATRQSILTPARIALILCAITVLAARLRLHSLGAHSLWIDEASSFAFATMPWRLFLHTLWSYQGNMTLYYFLLRVWVHLGDSEFMVRLLSVIFSVLTIPAIYALGKRLFEGPTGVIAATLLSVHSFHILWSQQARAYSLLLLLLVSAGYFLVRAIESDNTRYWMFFAITAALSVYAHLFAVLVLAGFAVSILWSRPYKISTRNLLITAILFEHLAAPMVIWVLLRHSDQINWIPKPSWPEFYGFLQLLTSQGGMILVLLYLSMGALAFLPMPGTARSEKEEWGLRLLVFWLILPPLLTLAVSPVKPLFDPGFMVICVPPVVLLAARGLVKLSYAPAVKYWATAAAFGLMVWLSVASIPRPAKYQITLNADWRSAVNYVLAHESTGDGAVFYTPNAYPFLYYTRRAEEQHRVATAPEVLYPPDPWQPLSREEIERVTAGHQRVWLILHNERSHPLEVSEIRTALGERHKLLDERVFPSDSIPITVDLYGTSPPPARQPY